MNEPIGQSLRIYSRQLMAQLKDKEEDFTDLQKRFSKLQGRFAQLDYAFKNNLKLHQEQMIEIHDLRRSQEELQKVERDRWKQFCKLEDQLLELTNEKEATKNDLAYWKRAVIDQKKFYEGKFEECLRECKLKMEADARFHQRTLRETQTLAEKHIQEVANRYKLNNGEYEVIRKKAIILQGDVDVLRYRIEELATLIENSTGMNGNLESIRSCIVEILRSLSTSHDEYDRRIKELHDELHQRIPCSAVNPEEDNLPDYERLKSQNLVLREVVKKLKNELNKVQKGEVILQNPKGEENPEMNELRKKFIELNSENKKLCNLLVEKDAGLRQMDIENKENIIKLENKMKSELIKFRENERQTIFSKSKSVEMDKRTISYTDSRENQDFDDDRSQEAYLGLEERGVEKFNQQPTRDIIKSPELNLESLKLRRSSDKNYVRFKDKQKVENNNTGNYLNIDENTHEKFSQNSPEPIESHLNSVQYKEYTIQLFKNHNLKIRHPIARGLTDDIFRFRYVHSEKEYQSIPIDETVFYFDCENDQIVFLDSKMTNCAVQTMQISKKTIYTQTKMSENILNSQSNTGVKILHSERQAIERSIRNLEKTVSEAGEEALGLARSLITNTNKFPPSEEFFDCIRYLSQYGTT